MWSYPQKLHPAGSGEGIPEFPGFSCFSCSDPTNSEPWFSPHAGGHHPPPDQAQENCLLLPWFLFIWYFHPVLQFTETGKESFGIFFWEGKCWGKIFWDGIPSRNEQSCPKNSVLGLFFKKKLGSLRNFFFLKKSILINWSYLNDKFNINEY